MAKKSFSLTSLKRAETLIVAVMCGFIALMAVGAWLAGWDNMKIALMRVDMQTALILFVTTVINIVLRGLRWQFFAQALHIQVPLKKLMFYYVCGMGLVPTPGKIGTLVRVWFIHKNHQVTFRRAAPLMLMDTLTDFISITLIAAFGSMIFAGFGFSMLFMFGLLAGVILVFLKPSFLRACLKSIYSLLGKKKPRLFASISHMLGFMRRLFTLFLLSRTVVLSSFAWLAMIWGFYELLIVMGAVVSFQACAFIFMFSVLVGGIALLPGGLGGTEATMVGLLLLIEVPLDVAVAATAVIRLTSLWIPVAVGLTFLPFGLRSIKK